VKKEPEPVAFQDIDPSKLLPDFYASLEAQNVSLSSLISLEGLDGIYAASVSVEMPKVPETIGFNVENLQLLSQLGGFDNLTIFHVKGISDSRYSIIHKPWDDYSNVFRV
jgi:hypothetical protein